MDNKDTGAKISGYLYKNGKPIKIDSYEELREHPTEEEIKNLEMVSVPYEPEVATWQMPQVCYPTIISGDGQSRRRERREREREQRKNKR